MNHSSPTKKKVESCAPGFRRHNEQCVGECWELTVHAVYQVRLAMIDIVFRCLSVYRVFSIESEKAIELK